MHHAGERQRLRLTRDTQLLQQLTLQGLYDALPLLHAATGDRPEARARRVALAAHQQDLARLLPRHQKRENVNSAAILINVRGH